MAEIRLLDQATIDQIAAGEVVERPRSVVKELTENAIDAGATALTVEIRDGGIGMIRVTDDGAGIGQDQVRAAFLRHATSKITKVDDLQSIRSFGFRGEALSSIASVSRMELITKTPGSLTGTRYRIEGGREVGLEEVGAPDGSTFLVRDLFYNTPARRKFLKSAQTEAGYIAEFCERLALSHPALSVRFLSGGSVKLSTSGNGTLLDVVYRVFGREISSNLIELDQTDPQTGMHLHGYLGKPQISRGNRTYEIFYVNGRLIASNILSKAAEEAYETFLMQHRFPFLILSLDLEGSQVDVNVHPTKAQVRFADGPAVYSFVREAVKGGLTHRDLIIKSTFGKEEKPAESSGQQPPADRKAAAWQRAREALLKESPEPFEKNRRQDQEDLRRSLVRERAESYGSSYDFSGLRKEQLTEADSPYSRKYPDLDSQRKAAQARINQDRKFLDSVAQVLDKVSGRQMNLGDLDPALKPKDTEAGAGADDTHFLTPEGQKEHRVIGQVFGTYWIVQFRSSLYIIDQHAAHEKVLFERLKKQIQNREVTSQQLNPPLILPLSMAEEDQLQANRETFRKMGFEIEPFGGRDYAISAVPQDLFGMTEKDFFLDLLDNLSADTNKKSLEEVTARVATMACKAAVKGKSGLTVQEAEALIDQLLALDDPYNCPHGRPTILSMTEQELEKKFKRIV